MLSIVQVCWVGVLGMGGVCRDGMASICGWVHVAWIDWWMLWCIFTCFPP